MKTAAPKRESGFALITVLWGLILLGLTAAAFAETVRSGVRSARNQIDAAEVRHLASAGLHLGVERLMRERLAGEEPTRYWSCAFGNATLRITVQDEAGRLDLNAMPLDLLAALLRETGLASKVADRLAAGIVDYRDADDEPLDLGAESEDYQRLDAVVLPKNARFDAVAEVQRVPVMSIEIYQRIRPLVTVGKSNPGLDPKAAGPTVLKAMDRYLGITSGDNRRSAREITELYFRQLYSKSPRDRYRISVSASMPSGAAGFSQNIVNLADGDVPHAAIEPIHGGVDAGVFRPIPAFASVQPC